MPARPLILAHRGASRRARENTLAAFALARELGADGVELDVRRTADHVLVVHHDPHIDGFGLLAAEPFAALRALHPDVPTLPEALAECAGLRVNVEIKCLPWERDADSADHRVVRDTTGVVRELAPDAIVSSFDLGTVDACRELAPELDTAWLTSGQEVAAGAEVARAHGHAWINPDRLSALRTSPEIIGRVRHSGLQVGVWTVDDPHEARQLARAGVDALITNVPDVVSGAFD
ncbi:MAG TPA: glycerophosphodiester phosphodiesterase [Acidimicrobiia bacterium]|nr:glycerophosphodiester phosphodiesterase [Acidimicrobiia bacterium]